MPERILLQLDPDPHASSFDAVVAVDAGVERLLQYSGVEETHVQDLVYGAIFTRGVNDLRHTAIFVGGSDVAAGQRLFAKVQQTFFGPMRVSVLMDANGSNTTAAAALLSAVQHLDFQDQTVLVLAGTGPVGQRVARLSAGLGAQVRLASRRLDRATEVCQAIQAAQPAAQLTPLQISSTEELSDSLRDCRAVFACGTTGVQLADRHSWQSAKALQVAVDLNAVPPVGLESIEPTFRDELIGSVHCYGAIGVGGLKMKIHKACLQRLFDSNDQVLDAEEVFRIGRELTGS